MQIVAWAAFFGCFLLFAGQPSWSEAGAGVPAAWLAAAFFLYSRRSEGRRLAFRRAPWRKLATPLAALLPDAVRVGRVLLQTLRRRPDGECGARQAQPFLHGDDSAPDAGRRGLVTLGVSFAPNGYVLDIPDGADTMLVHRLQPVPPRADHMWPL